MKLKNKMKPEWERFCQFFASDYETFGNATKSYAKAYNINLAEKGKYGTCRTNGARLLTNADILDRINQILAELVLNDTTVDMQLAFLITQMGDYSAKIQAIKEYNKLKQRITDKVEVKTDLIEKILEDSGLRAEVEKIRGTNERKDNEAVPSPPESQT